MDFIGFGVVIAIFIIAMSAHEMGHAYAAKYFGDDTAQEQGRLTLNPLKHIDLIGTILLPAIFLLIGGFLFGYAKPVPVVAGRLRNPKRDMMLVAFAGPAVNIILAVLTAVVLHALTWMATSDLFFTAKHIDSAMSTVQILTLFFRFNLMLAFFNLLPVPPLDGSHILRGLLPWSPYLARKWIIYTKYGFIGLMVVMFIVPSLTGINPIGWLILNPINWLTVTFLAS